MTTEQTVAQKLAQDAVDGLLKQAGKLAQQEIKTEEATIDPETQKKIIDREIKMAADPDFALAEEAKLSAADRMRRSRDRTPAFPPGKTEAGKDKTEVNVEIGRTAKAMLDMDIPPNVVAQYLIGSSTPQFPIALGGGANQGLTLADVLTLVDRMNQNKPDSELTEMLKSMREEIRSQRNSNPAPLDPIQQAENTVALVRRLKEAGIISEPAQAASGESIEVVKEKHRHAEKMEEIQTDRGFKEKLAAAVEDIPISLGKGLGAERASRQERGGHLSSSSEKESVSSFQCKNPDCKATIFIPPNPPSQLKCAKCGMVYEQTGSAAAESPPVPTSSKE